MSEFLVEAYVARTATAAPPIEAISLAAEELTREGADVSFLRAICVPEDETCFYHYRSSSAEAVREAVTRAGLPYERITEAVSREAKRPARTNLRP